MPSSTYYIENKERIAKVNKVYYDKNHDTILAKARVRSRKHDIALKIEVLSHYGNGNPKCITCGESRLPCLSIDHIDGGGADERRKFNIGAHTYWWLKSNEFPEGYQTLCMNCQWVKRAENKEYRRYGKA